MSTSMLAAVRAAALGSASPVAIAASQQEDPNMTTTAPAASAAAAAPAPAAPAVAAGKTYSQAEFNTAVSAARAEGRTEGGTAERARILGIEGLAMKGHEALISEMKADGATTPEQAALRIIEAEKAKGGDRLSAFQKIEAAASTVKAAPQSAAHSAPPAAKSLEAQASATAAKAREFIAAQAKLGITVSAAEAVAHVTAEG